ncbi:MAG TPA: CPBP family intramembrane glutamic endopeptidase [Thermoleophilia bacterium]|nr:CPBP family intramembrane glutamic endopeptidase [Thermoleophilia bacterium]
MSDRSGARISPWWMVAPAALFVLNFVLALFIKQPDQTNEVYQPGIILGTAGLDLALIAYVVVAAVVSHVDVRSTLALRRPDMPAAAKLAAALVVAVIAVNLVADGLTNASVKQGIAPTHDPRTHGQWVALVIALVALIVVAPVAEEFVFRGLAFATLGRYSLVASAALFAVAHGMAVLLVPVFLAGLALGYARQRTGSLYTGMAMHMTLNAIALVAALLT